jgi:hypothetical protein
LTGSEATSPELGRDMARKRLVAEQIHEIEKARLEQLKRAPKAGPNLMVVLLVRVLGIGIETADMLVTEIFSRNLRDRRAVARYGGLTGAPDKRKQTPREGACPIRQRSGAAGNDPTRLALPRVPEGERLDQVV